MTMPYGAASAGPARKRKPTGNTAYDASLSATEAQADVAREDFTRDIGERLGGLNSIGALRSGGSAVAAREAADTYSTRVSQAAAGNALSFAEMEQRKNEAALDRSGTDRRFDADLGFQRERAGRSDMESDRGFTEDTRRFDTEFGEGKRRFDTDDAYRTGRASRSDFEADRGFTEDTRRFNVDDQYRTGRAGRADFESDRGFGEDTRRFDTSFNEDRRRNDRDFTEDKDRFGMNYDLDQRRFGEDTRRFDVGFNEDTRRYDQGFTRDNYNQDREFSAGRDDEMYGRKTYQQERTDAINEAKKQRKSSLWGSVLGLAGTVGGALVGGPIGAAVGKKIAGKVAGGG